MTINEAALMRGKLAQSDQSDQIVLHITYAELLLLAGSMNEVIELVEDWEFSARLGTDKANARALRSELGNLVAMLSPERLGSRMATQGCAPGSELEDI
jgi:hypothetical protein